MILFGGCSFTWGAGLQFEYLMDNDGWDIERCNRLIPPQSFMENLSYDSDIYRKQYHFPNLVAKHFNKHYALINYGNGGDNVNIHFGLKHLDKHIIYEPENNKNPISLFVIQFTDWTRMSDFSIEEQVENIAKELGDRNWIALSWFDDISDYLLDNYSDNFCPIQYKQNTYKSFSHIVELPHNRAQAERITLEGRYKGFNDHHFSSKGHRIIGNSIIKKIEENNLL